MSRCELPRAYCDNWALRTSIVVHSRYICLARRACFLAGVPESGQTLTTWAGRALACARYTQDPNERGVGSLDASGSAGVSSRGVGLRGFESHPPHQRYNLETPTKFGDSIAPV